ncbi:hypothetical protein CYMTET_21903 [Cymbomonas tetramitiformis]|uniref:Uncharacterized protein n=1 Tax=Cymbomonas tetramitiformis TaxID=36881 RepID=A0AAE0G122_9CHLO|nr:hypothetical protein CYMTET_21903 [Cymbomonas tetramitiformis]
MARDMLMVDAELCEDMAVMREDDPELYTPMQDADEVAESYRKYVIRVELHNILNRLEVDYTDRNRDAVIANDTSGVLMRPAEEEAAVKEGEAKEAGMAKEEQRRGGDGRRREATGGRRRGGEGGGGEGEGGGGEGKGGGGEGEGGGKVGRRRMAKEGEAKEAEMAKEEEAKEEAMATTVVEEFECTKRWYLRFARM